MKKSDEKVVWLLTLIFEIILLKHLWNYIMVRIFGLPMIGYWESFCINVMCGMLFISGVQTRMLTKIKETIVKEDKDDKPR